MATRILVQCRTDEMPGPLQEKELRMANTACQKVWNRDFNTPNGDRLTTFGGYYNSKCILLIDHGPVDATEYTTMHFNWNGREL